MIPGVSRKLQWQRVLCWIAVGGAWLAWSPVAGANEKAGLVPGARPPLVLVVSRKTALENLTFLEVRLVFLAQKQFVSGKRVIPLNHSPLTETRVAFDRLVLGLTPDQAGKYWIDRKIKGQGDPPKSIAVVSLLLKVVGMLEGAISYVRAEQLTPDVKALRVDGKVHQDRDYPLRE